MFARRRSRPAFIGTGLFSSVLDLEKSSPSFVWDSLLSPLASGIEEVQRKKARYLRLAASSGYVEALFLYSVVLASDGVKNYDHAFQCAQFLASGLNAFRHHGYLQMINILWLQWNLIKGAEESGLLHIYRLALFARKRLRDSRGGITKANVHLLSWAEILLFHTIEEYEKRGWIKPCEESSLQWLREAAEHGGVSHAQYLYGIALKRTNNRKPYVAWFACGRASGHVPAQLDLASWYLRRKRKRASLRWYAAASSSGCAEATFALATEDQLFSLLRMAADQGMCSLRFRWPVFWTSKWITTCLH